jgi:hypothetical protein
LPRFPHHVGKLPKLCRDACGHGWRETQRGVVVLMWSGSGLPSGRPLGTTLEVFKALHCGFLCPKRDNHTARAVVSNLFDPVLLAARYDGEGFHSMSMVSALRRFKQLLTMHSGASTRAIGLPNALIAGGGSRLAFWK